MPLFPAQSVVAQAVSASDRRWQSHMQASAAAAGERQIDLETKLQDKLLDAQKEMTDAIVEAQKAVAEATTALAEVEDRQVEFDRQLVEETAALRRAIENGNAEAAAMLRRLVAELAAWTPTGGGVIDPELPLVNGKAWPAITGEIRLLVGNEAPPGWLICDGSYHRIADRPALFQVIAFKYGQIDSTLDGTTHFRLPQKSDLTADSVVLGDADLSYWIRT